MKMNRKDIVKKQNDTITKEIKRLARAAAITTLIGVCAGSAVYAADFSDVPEKSWYKGDLTNVLKDDRKLIEGYPDGKFRPESGFSVEQFAVIMVKMTGVKSVGESTGTWSKPWMEKAVELGLIKEGEFSSTTRPITRGEMAKIIIRYTEKYEQNTYTNDTYNIRNNIKDYDTIDKTLQPAVVKVYDLGIIGGYPDGTYGAGKSLKRSEAVAVVNKIANKDKRMGNKIEVSKLRQVTQEEFIDMKAFGDVQKVWEHTFKKFNSKFCEATMADIKSLDFKWAGYNRATSFTYDARKGLQLFWVMDEAGTLYHPFGPPVRYPIEDVAFNDYSGKMEGHTITRLIFWNEATDTYVSVPCSYKMVR